MQFDAVLIPPRRAHSVAQGFWHDRTINDDLERINPSPTRSDRMQGMLQQQATTKLGDASRWQELTLGLPFGRLAEPDEMAKLTVFCASPLCGYLSGSIINVDGGQMFTTPSK